MQHSDAAGVRGISRPDAQNEPVRRSILIIADDLTGAADSAAPFRQAGFSTLVLTRPSAPRSFIKQAQVVSLCLNTRDVAQGAVHRLWQRYTTDIRGLAQAALVYQKIDSTLRGRPALEVRLLRDLLGAAAALIVPAYPKLGRQTIDGVHRVHGVALADTEYVRPPNHRLCTPATSHLLTLFDSGYDRASVHLPHQIIDRGVDVVAHWLQDRLAASCRLITADAADERHLDILTEAALPLAGRVLLVGSGGWAERLALACKTLMADSPAGPGALGIVGSLSATATRQVDVARQSGVTVLPWRSLAAYTVPEETAQAGVSVAEMLSVGHSVILWTHPGNQPPGSRQAGRRLLHAVAERVREILDSVSVSGLIIVGGDTAGMVLRALRTSGLVLLGEVAPGVPYGRVADGPCAGLPIVTKAGGFGADTVLHEALMFLQHHSDQ